MEVVWLVWALVTDTQFFFTLHHVDLGIPSLSMLYIAALCWYVCILKSAAAASSTATAG